MKRRGLVHLLIGGAALLLVVGLETNSLRRAVATCSPQFFVWKNVGGGGNYGSYVVANSSGVFTSLQGLEWCYDTDPTQGWVEHYEDDPWTVNILTNTIDISPDYWQPQFEPQELDITWEGQLDDEYEDGNLSVKAIHWPGRLGGSTDQTNKVVSVHSSL